jgi:hypothetical protein
MPLNAYIFSSFAVDEDVAHSREQSKCLLPRSQPLRFNPLVYCRGFVGRVGLSADRIDSGTISPGDARHLL